MSIACLYCPTRLAKAGTKHHRGVQVGRTRGVCSCCREYMRAHGMDEDKLMRAGLLLPAAVKGWIPRHECLPARS